MWCSPVLLSATCLLQLCGSWSLSLPSPRFIRGSRTSATPKSNNFLQVDSGIQHRARARVLPCMNNCGSQVDLGPGNEGTQPARRGVCVHGHCLCLPGFSGPDCSQGRAEFIPLPQHVEGQPDLDLATGDVLNNPGNSKKGLPTPDEEALINSDLVDSETADATCDATICTRLCTYGGSCTSKFICVCFDKWHRGPPEMAGLLSSTTLQSEDKDEPGRDGADKNSMVRKPLQMDQQATLKTLFKAWGAFDGKLPAGDPCTMKSDVKGLENGWLTEQGFAVVLCNTEGLVEELDLSRMSLKGSIPPSIGNLKALKFLSLSNNNMTGHIPEELGELSKLETLLLYRNRLSGPLPASIFENCPLKNVVLYGNLLTGPIPSSIKFVGRTLIHLDLSYNLLSGSIPASVVRLARLETMFLNHNKLSGPVPTTFRQLSNIKILRIEENDFSNGFATKETETKSNSPVFSDSANDHLGEDWFKEWKNGLKELPGSTEKEGTSFERWSKRIQTEEEEALSERYRVENESREAEKKRVGDEKIQKMQTDRLPNEDMRKPLPKIPDRQPSDTEVYDGT